ncbi:unannotated protein [freshwater metagenome]|uniref:Unannotated protein n=1 Tax=freshwater metagenome TaxID=449393 RepID=A0A6J7FLS7_9ZZZZ|nr:hypothetical protein [Actinomycetota bacterium]
MQTVGDYMLDPPDDPPLVDCPRCEGTGTIVADLDDAEDALEALIPGVEYDCPRCGGDGEDYLTDDEIRDHAAEREIERAEARRDGDL